MPKATVAAIILSDQGVLLTRRNHDPFKGYWCLPGGHIDEYERARDAVIREVKEETGLDYAPEFLGAFDEIFPGYGFHAVVGAYVGPGAGTLVPQASEVSEIGWFPLDTALTMQLAFVHGEILEAYAQRGV